MCIIMHITNKRIFQIRHVYLASCMTWMCCARTNATLFAALLTPESPTS